MFYLSEEKEANMVLRSATASPRGSMFGAIDWQWLETGVVRPNEYDNVKVHNPEEDEDLYEEEEQVFPENLELEQHFVRSMYYGGSAADTIDLDAPLEKLSLPLSELCVDEFKGVERLSTPRRKSLSRENSKESSSSISTPPPTPKRTLRNFDLESAAWIQNKTSTTPTALMLALLYLERIRAKNPSYVQQVSAPDLFLISMMVASKYLYDDGEDEEVFTDDWATAGNMTKRDLNDLEIKFLCAIDWSVNVEPEDFKSMTARVGEAIAVNELKKRSSSSSTYSDLTSMTHDSEQNSTLLKLLLECSIKITTVCVTAYAASILAMLGTISALNQTPFGPTASRQNVDLLFNGQQPSSSSSPGDRLPVIEDEDMTTSEMSSNYSSRPQTAISLSVINDPHAEWISELDRMVNHGGTTNFGNNNFDKEEENKSMGFDSGFVDLSPSRLRMCPVYNKRWLNDVLKFLFKEDNSGQDFDDPFSPFPTSSSERTAFLQQVAGGGKPVFFEFENCVGAH